MKQNVRRLNAILKLYPNDEFNSADIARDRVLLTAHYNSNLASSLLRNKFKAEVMSCGYVWFTRPNYIIVLT